MTDSSILPPERTGDVIRAVREVMEQYFEPRIEVVKDVTGEEIPVLVTGQQQNVKLFSPEDFDPFREQPLRRSGTTVLTALESFGAHVNRFTDEHSIIFASADRAAPSLPGTSHSPPP